MEQTVCNIEIVKDGRDFVARALMSDGTRREFRNQVFEDVVTEMVIELQEEFSE
ncbi:MAG: hypothetical protein V5A64_00905 [Candidatus Thermoplasmatota archaeon]